MAASLPLLYSTSQSPLTPQRAKTKGKQMNTKNHQSRNGLKDRGSAGQPPTEADLRTAFLCYEITYFLLKEAGIRMNGYLSGSDSPKPPSHACLTEPDFSRAYGRLKEGCMDLKARHEADMVSMVKELDISHSGLYETFYKVCSTIVKDEINWGRITSLFTFTGYLAMRLYNEGQREQIDSLIVWEARFVSERVLPWVQRHGGWAGINNGLCLVEHSHSRAATGRGNEGGGWWAMAAIGLGAIVVGGIGLVSSR